MTRTIEDTLRDAARRLLDAGVDSPRLDAELMLAHARRCDRLSLVRDRDDDLAPSIAGEFGAMVARRTLHEPVAYIIGVKEFYGREFVVEPAVLIPRPETEHLVEASTEIVRHRRAPRVIDIGAGSGAIGVTLAAELDRHVVCSDISSDALQIARRNARRHSVENRVSFVVSDLLNAFNAPFDLILSNPPYIGLGERDSLAPDVREFEPEGALFSGPEGLDVIARLIDEAPRLLRPGGQMLLEIGAGQSRAVSELARLNGAWREAVFVSDLSGHDRVAVLTAVPQP